MAFNARGPIRYNPELSSFDVLLSSSFCFFTRNEVFSFLIKYSGSGEFQSDGGSFLSCHTSFCNDANLRFLILPSILGKIFDMTLLKRTQINIVNSQIEVIPKVRLSTAATTKFYLLFSKRPDHSNNICNISKIERNAKRKRSLSEFNDLQNAKNCPLSRPKLKPSSMKLANNDSNFIRETPESILVADSPTEYSTEYVETDPSETHSVSDELSITSKRDLTRPKLQPRVQIDSSSAEGIEETVETFSDWRINYETIGENLQLLHLKYIHPVESTFQATYEIMCGMENTAILHLILQPYINLTHHDILVNKDEFDYAHYVENPPCSCDVSLFTCDKNCCCDKNCSTDALQFFGCSEPFRKTGKHLKQPTGYECTSRSTSPLCITGDTSSFIDRFHSNEPILNTLKMYNERVTTINKMDFLIKPHSFSWVDDHYVQGSPIQIKLQNGNLGFWTISKSFFGDNCIKTSPVFFQINQLSTCSVQVEPSNCDQNGPLSVDFYIPWRTGPNSTHRYVFLEELFGTKSAPIDAMYKCETNCGDFNPVTSVNDSHCINPVIEAKYNFYWQGPKIERIVIELLTAPSAAISESIKQSFEVNFIHKPRTNTTKKKLMEENTTLPTFQSDANGFCLHEFSSVDIGESTLSSCRLKVDDAASQSCSAYRNFTLCDTSSHVYNTCLEIPTKILVQVMFADLSEFNVPISLKMLGIRVSLHPNVCYPPVGLEPEETNFSIIEKDDEHNVPTISCKPKKDVFIQSEIVFLRNSREQYSFIVDFYRNRMSLFYSVFHHHIIHEISYFFS
uniref:Uncharacterized protein n=1 Tax=Strigamia maritima TaxID=126957 RepID=T1J2L7_STRMM